MYSFITALCYPQTISTAQAGGLDRLRLAQSNRPDDHITLLNSGISDRHPSDCVPQSRQAVSFGVRECDEVAVIR